MLLQKWVARAAVLGLVAASAHLAIAQQNDNDQTFARRLAAQEQRIAELETTLSQREQPFQVQTAAWNHETLARRLEVLEAAVAGGGKDDGKGWIDSHDQKWDTTWGGRVFFDYANFASQNADSALLFDDVQDYAEFRSIRLFAEGTGYGVFGYRLELEFAPEANVSVPGIQGPTTGFQTPAIRVEDAYVGIRDVPFLGTVVLGNQKVPFGLEALTRGEHLTYMERAKPVERAFPDFPAVAPPGPQFGPLDGDVPLRRVGIAAYNHSDCPRWAYQGGIFFEDVDPLLKQRISDQQGIELAMRGVFLPLYANGGRQLIHVGAGLDYVDDADDFVVFAYRPEIHEAPITTASGGNGADDYLRVNLEGAAVFGPASVQTELFATRVEDLGVDFYGAYVSASYFLTGENRGYDPTLGVFGRVAPLENFWIVNTNDGPCIGLGAWEAAIRWSYVDVSDGALAPIAGTENNLTFGLNWYWNPYARMMFNYIHAWDSYSLGGKPELDILAFRWQVDF